MRQAMFGELDKEMLREGLGRLTSAFGRSELAPDTQEVWLRRLAAHGVRFEHFAAAVERCMDVEPRFPVMSVLLSRCIEARRAREQRLRDDSRRLMRVLREHAPALYDAIALELRGDLIAQVVAKELGLADDVRAVLTHAGISYESRGVTP